MKPIGFFRWWRGPGLKHRAHDPPHLFLFHYTRDFLSVELKASFPHTEHLSSPPKRPYWAFIPGWLDLDGLYILEIGKRVNLQGTFKEHTVLPLWCTRNRETSFCDITVSSLPYTLLRWSTYTRETHLLSSHFSPKHAHLVKNILLLERRKNIKRYSLHTVYWPSRQCESVKRNRSHSRSLKGKCPKMIWT